MVESTDTKPLETFPTSRQEFFLRGPEGRLVCVADVPGSADEGPATIVLCHPHPLHGGTMHNKVITIMERSMRELGLRTIRFNFRCAGESEGEHDEGYGETGFEGIFNRTYPMIILDDNSRRSLAIQDPDDACHAPFHGIAITDHRRFVALCIRFAQDVKWSFAIVILSCSSVWI